MERWLPTSAAPGPVTRHAARAAHLISTPVVTLAPAGSLPLTALTDLFNAGYSDYLVPLRLDEAASRAHVAVNDIDLACPRVVVAAAAQPVSFALIGRRGEAGW